MNRRGRRPGRLPGPGASSRSSTPRAGRSPSGAASCPAGRGAAARAATAARAQVQELPGDGRSTPSAAPSTGSTGPSRTSWPPARSSSARATPTSSASSGRDPAGRGHLRHRAGRGALPLLRNFAKRIVLAYDADSAGQCGHRPGLRVGAPPRGRRGRGRPAPGRDPADLARTDPDALREARRRGPAVPAVPGRPGLRSAPTCARPRAGPRRPSGSGRGGRASRRPRARPVRDADRPTAAGSSPTVRERLERGPPATGPGPWTAAPTGRDSAGGQRAADAESAGTPSDRARPEPEGRRRRRGLPARRRAAGARGSRPCAWPCTDPRKWPTAWRRCCSSTSSSAGPSSRCRGRRPPRGDRGGRRPTWPISCDGWRSRNRSRRGSDADVDGGRPLVREPPAGPWPTSRPRPGCRPSDWATAAADGRVRRGSRNSTIRTPVAKPPTGC